MSDTKSYAITGLYEGELAIPIKSKDGTVHTYAYHIIATSDAPIDELYIHELVRGLASKAPATDIQSIIKYSDVHYLTVSLKLFEII